MILPPDVEVSKVSLKAGQGVDGDVSPVPKSSGKNDFLSVADSARIAGDDN